MKYLALLFLSAQLLGQTNLYFPWVPQNETFQSRLIINNHHSDVVEVQLKALRTPAFTEETTVTLGPFESLQALASQLFPNLAEGAGYAVTLTATSNQISATNVITSTTTASGDSPSQMNAIPSDKASPILGFHHLPNKSGGFSAPVIVNVGDTPALVTFHGFLNGIEIGTARRNLLPGEVFARQTSEMFPGQEGDLYVIAESSQPLVGASFIFNELREPSMAAAQPVASLPDPFSVLTQLKIDPSRNALRPNQPKQMVAEATYLQGAPADVTQEVTWSSSDLETVSISNSGADKGTATAHKQGNAIITATLGDFSDTLTVTVLPPQLKLELATFCQNDPPECTEWQDYLIPANIRKGSVAIFFGEATRIIETLRISSLDGAFTISRISAVDLTGNIPIKIAGLQEGQTIPGNQETIFQIEAGRTFGAIHTLAINIGVEGIDTVLRMTLVYVSN